MDGTTVGTAAGGGEGGAGPGHQAVPQQAVQQHQQQVGCKRDGEDHRQDKAVQPVHLHTTKHLSPSL